MTTFIDNVLTRLKQLNKKQSHLTRELAINKATFSMWKQKKRIPRADIAVKIATYLNTSVEELVIGNTHEASTSDAYLEKIIECSGKMTPEQRNELANIAESLLDCNHKTAVKIADLVEHLAKLERNDADMVKESADNEYLDTFQTLKSQLQERAQVSSHLSLRSS